MSTKVYICHLSWYQSRHVLIEDFTSCTDSVSGRVYLSNLLTHYVCSTNSSRSALFWVQLYCTFWTDPFSGNKLITTTTLSNFSTLSPPCSCPPRPPFPGAPCPPCPPCPHCLPYTPCPTCPCAPCPPCLPCPPCRCPPRMLSILWMYGMDGEFT